MPAPSNIRDRVFISYSHADRDWLHRLQKHLKPYTRNHSINFWDDTKIKPGTLWKNEIETELASAKVAVLLVSVDFLDSDFIANNELPPLLLAAKSEGLVVLWIYIKTCSYKQTDIADFQAAHDIAKPLATLDDPRVDETFVKICEMIKEALNP